VPCKFDLIFFYLGNFINELERSAEQEHGAVEQRDFGGAGVEAEHEKFAGYTYFFDIFLHIGNIFYNVKVGEDLK
jgi:hypothetical protein